MAAPKPPTSAQVRDLIEGVERQVREGREERQSAASGKDASEQPVAKTVNRAADSP